MNDNVMGVVFVVDEEMVLLGSLSDGDIRRAVLDGAFDRTVPVSAIMNRQPSVLPVGASPEETYMALSKGLSEGKTVFPRTDALGRVRSFAYREDWGLIPIAEPSLNGNEFKYVAECLSSNWISSTGPYVGRFEQAFADYMGVSRAVAVSNGTVALTLALQALGMPSGAEVVVPDCTFAASANAVVAAGGRVVLADIDEVTWGLSPETVQAAVGPDTWGVLAVHLYGNPCDIVGLRNFCDDKGLMLVEDCAEAVGTYVDGRHAGNFGDASAFSFFGNKTLTTGEGGMVAFKEDGHEQRARLLRDHGMSKERRYWHEVVGFNYRMTNLQAAIGLAQMERASELVGKKLANAAIYLEGSASLTRLRPIPISPFGQCSFWLVPYTLDEDNAGEREELMNFLASHGIQSRVTFPSLHQMPAFVECRKSTDLTNSLNIAALGFCLPNNPSMTADDVIHIVEVLTEFESMRDT